MIRKITVDGKTKEYKVRDLAHLDACIKYHSTVVRNRKKYTRKEKHKVNYC